MGTNHAKMGTMARLIGKDGSESSTSFVNRGKQRAGRIFGVIGSHEAEPHSHPYMVSLQLGFLWVQLHICGGVLIADKWVLTAGDCITSWVTYILELYAVAGAHDAYNPEITALHLKVVERIPHPEFDSESRSHDIGLARTKFPFFISKEIQPIHLATGSKLYPTLILIGWGRLGESFLFSKLQEVKQEYIPHEKCNKALLENGETNTLVEEANICAGPITIDGITVCNGDSGGPLIEYVPKLKRGVIRDKGDSLDYVPVLLGIVSWSTSSCGEVGAPTVFTNVTDNMDFITEHTKIKL